MLVARHATGGAHIDFRNAMENQKARTRWYQFRLRTLLVVTTVSAVLFGLFSARLRDARRREQAIARFLELHASLQITYGTGDDARDIYPQHMRPPDVRFVPAWLEDLLGKHFFLTVSALQCRIYDRHRVRDNPRAPSEDIFNEQLKLAGRFHELHALWLHHEVLANDSPVSANSISALSQIGRLRKLRILSLSVSYPYKTTGGKDKWHLARNTGEELEHLAGLRDLWYLQLQSIPIHPDRGLRFLRSLPNLTHVSLLFCPVRDEHLSHLPRSAKLASLNLSGTIIGDIGVAHLSEFTSLKKLHLAITRVSDDGLRHLRGMKDLEELSLSHTSVSAEGIRSLKGLPKLRQLSLGHTKVKRSETQELLSLFPALQTIDFQ